MRETVKCDRFATVDELGRRNHSSSITFEECMSMNMLISPDAKKPLSFFLEKGILTDGLDEYPVNAGIPILHSQKILKVLNNGPLKLDYYEDSLVQYYLLSQIKHHFAHNAPAASRPYEKHLYRFSKFCENISGLVLDVGCDDPRVGATIFPEKCKYIGIDPMMSGDSFRISSIAEILPFADQSFDNVVFNTSLDHILDYHTAIEEASRVLRKDGNIIISTYIWDEGATLLTDLFHFHHYRYTQIIDALSAFDLTQQIIYQCPKKDTHRHELMIMASKPA
jgi:SAM-dependent methyltransferase